jgi:hypothetical protein
VRDPSNSTLADYSGAPNNYLECVPTYRHATAGLQGGNAFMARDLADLREAQGNVTGAAALRARADAIAAETVARMYISATTSGKTNGTSPGDVGGWFRVIDTGNGGAETTEVRHVVDFVYAAMGLCNPRWSASCAFNATVSAQMVDYFFRQLAIPGSGAWIRAMSLFDTAAPIERPDHGTTGAYPAWPSMAFDALVSLDGGSFDAALSYLANLAAAVEEGPFGQAHAITNDGYGVFKTTDGCIRYIADDGASFAESILRVVFGYDPGYFSDAPGATNSSWQPAYPGVLRGTLSGTMRCVRSPASADAADPPKYLTLTLTQGALSWAWDPTCGA